MNTSRRKVAMLGLAFALWSMAAGATAQDIATERENLQQTDARQVYQFSPEEMFNIDVTTASLTKEKAGQSPATIRVVTGEQIRTRCYQSIIDVLRDLPDFKIDDMNQEEQYNIVTQRGIRNQNNIVLLLNGKRISSPTNEVMPYIYNYPVHFAKQIEIVYGPASALYGADAVAGVINIITEDAEGEFTAEVMPVVGNGGLYGMNLYGGGSFEKNVSLTVSGSYYYDEGFDLSDIYDDDPDMDFSSHEEGTFPTIFGPITPEEPVRDAYEAPVETYAIQAGLQLYDFRVELFRSYSEVSTSLGNSPANSVFNKEVFYGQSVTMFSADLTKAFDEFVYKPSVTMSWYEVNPESNFRNTFVQMEKGYKYGYGSMLKADQQLIWTPDLNFTLIGGLTYERFTSVPKGPDLDEPVDRSGAISANYIGTDRPARFFTLAYYNVGGFLQAQYSLLAETLTLTAGARYDNNSRFSATFNPRFGVVYSPTEKITFKALYGSAFLAPPPLLAYGNFGSVNFDEEQGLFTSPFWRLPNPGLDAFRSQTFEGGVRALPTENLSLELTGYYTLSENLFSLVPAAGNVDDYGEPFSFTDSLGNTTQYMGQFDDLAVEFIEVYDNQGDSRNWGGSLRADYLATFTPRFSVNAYASVTWMEGEIDEVSRGDGQFELGGIAPLQFHVGADVSYGRFSASPRLVAVGEQRLFTFQNDADGNDGDKRHTVPGYELLNMALRYRFGKDDYVFVNVRNLLNQKYRASRELSDPDAPADVVLRNGSPQNPIRLEVGFRYRI